MQGAPQRNGTQSTDESDRHQHVLKSRILTAGKQKADPQKDYGQQHEKSHVADEGVRGADDN